MLRSAAQLRSEMVMFMQSDQPMELPPPVKLPDPPSRERLRSRERGPFSPRSESMMSMQSDQPMELLRSFKLPDQPSRRQYVSPLEPRPHLPLRQYVSPFEPGPIISRSESMMSMQSDRPMELPPPVKRPDPPSRSNPEKISAGSPASSCVSMMSARSMDFPLSFKGLLFLVGVRTSFIFCGLLFLVGVRTSFIFPSFLTILFTMGGLEEAVRSLKLQVEANERAEEESEDSLLRLWIMKLLLNLLVGVRTSFIFCGSLTILFTMGGLEEAVRYLKLQVEANERQKAGSPAPSLSVESDRSRTPPLNFSDEPGPSDTKDPEINAGPCTDLNYRDSLLRENIVDYVDDELNRLKRLLTNDPEGLESQGEYEEGLNVKEEAQRRGSRKGFLKITLDFLRRMNQEELADALQDKALAAVGHRKPKSKLKNTIGCVFDGFARAMRSGPMFK